MSWDFREKPRNVKELDDAMWGRSRSAKKKSGSWNKGGGGKRCPMCRGDAGRFEGQGFCYASSCGRGPGGRTCDCHGTLGAPPSARRVDGVARQDFGVRRF